MNIRKLISPDFLPGRALSAAKMSFDLTDMLLHRPSKEVLRIMRLVLKVKPKYTMVKLKNLIQLYELVQRVNQLRLPGDIVECGVWNGGSAAIMGAACVQSQTDRTLWLFDSFEGLPPPGEHDAEQARKSFFPGWNKGDMGKVKRAFDRLGVPQTWVRIIPGWFETTLAAAPIESIAVLHIDADFYASVRIALDVFYAKVVPGGFIVLDDYAQWQGCNNALEDFLAENHICAVDMRQVCSTGAYFRKPE